MIESINLSNLGHKSNYDLDLWYSYVMNSEILGLMEKKFEMFAFSNSFVFWEKTLRSKNEIPRKYVKSAENLHYTTILFAVFIGHNLPMSSKCLENVAFLLQRVPMLEVP